MKRLTATVVPDALAAFQTATVQLFWTSENLSPDKAPNVCAGMPSFANLCW